MSVEDIPLLYSCLLSIRSSIHELFDETDKVLTKAKETKSGKDLDKFFDNYRKDKSLKICFLVLLNDIIKYIKSNPDYNILKNYTKLFLAVSSLIDLHETTIGLNNLGQSNAMIHFSTQGIILINSSDFSKLNDIYKKIYLIHRHNYSL